MTAQWKDYRQRRVAFFVAWIGGFGVLGLACLVASFFRRYSIPIILPVWVAWISFSFITLAWLRAFRCPRCREVFLPPFIGGRDPQKFLYSPRCMHCGLLAYGDPKT
jgi:hypothetical protein